MKHGIHVAIWSAPAAALLPAAAAAQVALYRCPACPVESKVPSAEKPGEFDYQLKCIEDGTNYTIIVAVTAPNDTAAVKKAWVSPTIQDNMAGMEVNAYVCAEY